MAQKHTPGGVRPKARRQFVSNSTRNSKCSFLTAPFNIDVQLPVSGTGVFNTNQRFPSWIYFQVTFLLVTLAVTQTWTPCDGPLFFLVSFLDANLIPKKFANRMNFVWRCIITDNGWKSQDKLSEYKLSSCWVYVVYCAVNDVAGDFFDDGGEALMDTAWMMTDKPRK